jgi:predicted anti-sigma-YlaC factor YlaD
MCCFDVQMELEGYLDGELSPERTALVERHLAGCHGCWEELVRLQAVVAALETWPLVAEPAQLAARVMAQVRQRSVVSPSATRKTGAAEPLAVPGFRIHWSDLTISLAGASLVFAATLLWRYLTSTDLVYLYRTQMYLRLEMLRLELVLLLAQCLARTSAAAWGLMLVGVALVTALALVMWDLAVWKREALSA